MLISTHHAVPTTQKKHEHLDPTQPSTREAQGSQEQGGDVVELNSEQPATYSEVGRSVIRLTHDVARSYQKQDFGLQAYQKGLATLRSHNEATKLERGLAELARKSAPVAVKVDSQELAAKVYRAMTVPIVQATPGPAAAVLAQTLKKGLDVVHGTQTSSSIGRVRTMAQKGFGELKQSELLNSSQKLMASLGHSLVVSSEQTGMKLSKDLLTRIAKNQSAGETDTEVLANTSLSLAQKLLKPGEFNCEIDRQSLFSGALKTIEDSRTATKRDRSLIDFCTKFTTKKDSFRSQLQESVLHRLSQSPEGNSSAEIAKVTLDTLTRVEKLKSNQDPHYRSDLFRHSFSEILDSKASTQNQKFVARYALDKICSTSPDAEVKRTMALEMIAGTTELQLAALQGS